MNGMPEVNELVTVDEVDATDAPSPPRHVPFVYRTLTYLVQLPLVGLSTGFFGSLSLISGLWDKSMTIRPTPPAMPKAVRTQVLGRNTTPERTTRMCLVRPDTAL